jgi:UDP-2,3-diacylglucosamine pyrophosphatase LpxH
MNMPLSPAQVRALYPGFARELHLTETAEARFARALCDTGDDDATDPRRHEPHKYRAVFFSDVHLGTLSSCGGDLVKFLDHFDAEYIFIVGDLFDIWQLGGLDLFQIQKVSLAQTTVLTKIWKHSRKGAKITFVPGNHDELFRDKLTAAPVGNVDIRFDAAHVTAQGMHILLMHGDSFDEIVRGYRFLSKLGTRANERLGNLSVGIDRLRANTRVNRAFEALGFERHWSLAHAIRTASDGATYNASFEEAMRLHVAARNTRIAEDNKDCAQALRKQPFGAIMCGHTHVPARKWLTMPYNQGHEAPAPEQVLFLNTGSWVGRPKGSIGTPDEKWREKQKIPVCTAIVEHMDGRLEHVRWEPERGIMPMTHLDKKGLFLNQPYRPAVSPSDARTAERAPEAAY